MAPRRLDRTVDRDFARRAVGDRGLEEEVDEFLRVMVMGVPRAVRVEIMRGSRDAWVWG
jgi:hypothetical protein